MGLTVIKERPENRAAGPEIGQFLPTPGGLRRPDRA